MANKEWQGTTADWNTAGNWSGASVPVDGDDVFFTGASSQSVDGLTLGVAGDALASINVHADYTGSIGSAATPVVAASCTTVRMDAKTGQLFLDGGTVTSWHLTAQGRSDFCQIDGTIAALYVSGASGSAKVVTGCDLDAIYQDSAANFVLTLESGLVSLDTIIQMSGHIKNSSDVDPGGSGVVRVHGGLYEQLGSGDLEDVYVHSGAVLKHKSSAGLANLWVFNGGRFDGRENDNPPTITLDQVNVFGGGSVLLRNGLNSYSVTASSGFGSGFTFDLGDQIAT